MFLERTATQLHQKTTTRIAIKPELVVFIGGDLFKIKVDFGHFISEERLSLIDENVAHLDVLCKQAVEIYIDIIHHLLNILHRKVSHNGS